MKKLPRAVKRKKAMPPSAVDDPGDDRHAMQDLSPAATASMSGEVFYLSSHDLVESIGRLSDQELDGRIAALRTACDAVASVLPDNGSNLKIGLFMHQHEKDRRLLAAMLEEKDVKLVAEPKMKTQASKMPVAADVLDTSESGLSDLSKCSGQPSSSSSRRNVKRGRYRGERLMKARSKAGRPLVAYVSDVWKVVGDHFDHFSSECSRAAKDLWPLGNLTPSQFERKVLLRVIPVVRHVFSFQPEVEIVGMDESQRREFDNNVNKMILHQAAKGWRNWKSNLHKKFKECHHIDEWFTIKPNEISEERWEELTNHFLNEKFMKRSARAIENRSHQEILRTTGRQTLEQVRFDKNLKDSIQVWKNTHVYPRGRWKSTKAKEVYEKEEAIKNEALQGDEDETAPDPQIIMTQLLGHRSGHVRGRSSGVQPLTKKQYTALTNSEAHHSSQVVSLKEKIKALEKQREDDMRARAKMEKQIAYLMARAENLF